MDYETFVTFFDRLRKEKELIIGDYTIQYTCLNDVTILTGSCEYIHYYKDKYKLGFDSLCEQYEIGKVSPRLKSTYEDSGIKNFDTLEPYLDYLYSSNIDRLVEEERQQELNYLKRKKEQERKQKKVDNFIGG